MGVPAVASPTPDNQRLHALGIGELAETPHHWRKKVRALIRSQAYRDDLAGRSREAVAASQTYEREENAMRWADAWTGKLAEAKVLI